MMQTRSSHDTAGKHVRQAGKVVGWLFLVLALVATACGSSGAEADEVQAAEESPATAEAAEPEPEEEEEAAEPEEDTEAEDEETSEAAALASDSATDPVVVELAEADWTDLTEWNLPAMGGLTFGLPEGHVVHHDADMVTIRSSYDDNRGRYEPSMLIALAAQTSPGAPLETIEAFTTSAIAGVGTAEPTNETLTLFGQELAGWRFTVDEGQPVGPHYLYSAYPVGVGGPTAWQPFPVAELYLAEVPGGILAVGTTARSEEDLAIARGIFDRVAPTLSLAQPIDVQLPPVVPLVNEPAPPPEPIDAPDGWPQLLTSISTPLAPGEYTVNALETAMSVAIGDNWWIQLNFPSWFILSGDESFGPGDRGILARTGIDAWYPTDRSGVVGDAIPFDIATLVTAPPPGIEIIESEDVTLGGADGTRIRLKIADDAGCGADDPCEYLLATLYPFPPESFRKGYVHDIWYLEGGLNSPVLINVVTPDEAWFDVANELLDTVVFDIAE